MLIVLPDESWQFSKWHYIIPNRIQMVSLAVKCGMLLKNEWQFTYQSGYLFEHGEIPEGDTMQQYEFYKKGLFEIKV